MSETPEALADEEYELLHEYYMEKLDALQEAAKYLGAEVKKEITLAHFPGGGFEEAVGQMQEALAPFVDLYAYTREGSGSWAPPFEDHVAEDGSIEYGLSRAQMREFRRLAAKDD